MKNPCKLNKKEAFQIKNLFNNIANSSKPALLIWYLTEFVHTHSGELIKALNNKLINPKNIGRLRNIVSFMSKRDLFFLLRGGQGTMNTRFIKAFIALNPAPPVFKTMMADDQSYRVSAAFSEKTLLIKHLLDSNAPKDVIMSLIRSAQELNDLLIAGYLSKAFRQKLLDYIVDHQPQQPCQQQAHSNLLDLYDHHVELKNLFIAAHQFCAKKTLVEYMNKIDRIIQSEANNPYRPIAISLLIRSLNESGLNVRDLAATPSEALDGSVAFLSRCLSNQAPLALNRSCSSAEPTSERTISTLTTESNDSVDKDFFVLAQRVAPPKHADTNASVDEDFFKATQQVDIGGEDTTDPYGLLTFQYQRSQKQGQSCLPQQPMLFLPIQPATNSAAQQNVRAPADQQPQQKKRKTA